MPDKFERSGKEVRKRSAGTYRRFPHEAAHLKKQTSPGEERKIPHPRLNPAQQNELLRKQGRMPRSTRHTSSSPGHSRPPGQQRVKSCPLIAETYEHRKPMLKNQATSLCRQPERVRRICSAAAPIQISKCPGQSCSLQRPHSKGTGRNQRDFFISRHT